MNFLQIEQHVLVELKTFSLKVNAAAKASIYWSSLVTLSDISQSQPYSKTGVSHNSGLVQTEGSLSILQDILQLMSFEVLIL